MTPSIDQYTTEELLAILDFVATLDYEVFELQTEGLTLYVNKTQPHRAREPNTLDSTYKAAEANQGPSTAIQPLSAPKVEDQTEDHRTSEIEAAASQGQHIITAPMVGTFYQAPEPGADPYVEVGSIVRAKDALCLLEVMKLFNTVASDVSGRVVAIYVKDGELVEYGQPLFAIDNSDE